MKPPKCKSCGKEEWRHVCGGPPKVRMAVPVGHVVRNAAPIAGDPGKFDRSAYQRSYMKDKRAAEKLGMTVKEYRAKGQT